VEPYVLAADVYARAPHAGRGGWTWYTGSAGWMYRLIIESFLGLRREANKLHFAPCIPREWESFKIHYRYINSVYHIHVIQKNGEGEMIVTVDGTEQIDKKVTLINDAVDHQVQIVIVNSTQ
jgi:cyclic beta-1,2-glucan synthetase